MKVLNYAARTGQSQTALLGRWLMLAAASLLLLGPASSEAGHHKKAHADDIIDTAVKAGTFKTLAAALGAADLVETLKGEGPFTVFAPTDEAFAKLPAGTVEELLKPENKEKLTQILTYHVVSGKVMASDLLKLSAAKTVNGQPVQIGLRVNDAAVVRADIKAANGVIHVIDSVILPPAANNDQAYHPHH